MSCYNYPSTGPTPPRINSNNYNGNNNGNNNGVNNVNGDSTASVNGPLNGNVNSVYNSVNNTNISTSNQLQQQQQQQSQSQLQQQQGLIGSLNNPARSSSRQSHRSTRADRPYHVSTIPGSGLVVSHSVNGGIANGGISSGSPYDVLLNNGDDRLSVKLNSTLNRSGFGGGTPSNSGLTLNGSNLHHHQQQPHHSSHHVISSSSSSHHHQSPHHQISHHSSQQQQQQHPLNPYSLTSGGGHSSSSRRRQNYVSHHHHHHHHHHNDESIDVSILPGDDVWADNTTAITGNTSDRSVSIDVDLNKIGKSGYNLSAINSFHNSTSNHPNHLNSSSSNSSSSNNLWNSSDWSTKCSIWCGPFTLGLLSLCAFISPLVMVILPQIETLEWKVKECGPECDGTLISCLFKLALLLILSYITFFTSPRCSLPRIDIYRALLMTLLTFLMVAYWVFYIEKIWDRRFSDYELTYQSIVQFSVSIVDVLLWIHFAAVVMLKLKPTESVFIIKVTRSPDGEARSYTIGQLSIQRAAVVVLEKYYSDFTIYNPYLELAPRRSRGKSMRGLNSLGPGSTLKYYDIDGIGTSGGGTNGTIIGNGSIVGGDHHITGNGSVGTSIGPGGNTLGLPGSLILGPHQGSSTLRGGNGINDTERIDEINNLEERGSRVGVRSTRHNRENLSNNNHHHSNHNDRFYEEHDYERRVRKRKARLLTAAEEAFTHIKRIRADEPCPISSPIDPKEASQAIFPAMARALQKFLRVTRQQPRHNVETIVDHLSTCLTYDLSPKAFLETYFNPRPVMSSSAEVKPMQSWGLVCDILLTRTIESGTVFMLRQNDVSLLVTVTSIPHLNITEEIIDPKCNKFVFKMNSETSV